MHKIPLERDVTTDFDRSYNRSQLHHSLIDPYRRPIRRRTARDPLEEATDPLLLAGVLSVPQVRLKGRKTVSALLIRSLPHTTARRPNSRSKTHLDRPVPREELIRLLLLDTVGHNDILTRGPIHRSSDLVLGRNLQRVDHSQELIDVPSRRSRVREDEADDLLGVDDEYRTDGEGESEGVDVGGVESVEHVVLGGDFAVLVADDGELQSAASRTRPSSVEVQVRSKDN